jgi:uncharacterized protein
MAVTTPACCRGHCHLRPQVRPDIGTKVSATLRMAEPGGQQADAGSGASPGLFGIDFPRTKPNHGANMATFRMAVFGLRSIGLIRGLKERGYRMGRALTSIVVAVGLMIGLTASAAANPFEDGVAAYEKGDYATALQAWLPLATAGDALAQIRVAALYADGRGVTRDYAEAAKWFRKAADQGNARAQFNLGTMFSHGQGVPQSHVEAVKWYRVAADQGHPFAQFNLGNMYAEGQGVPQSHAEAMKWYRLAAEQGHPGAQFSVASAYAKGQGAQQDDATAVKWATLAGNQGHVVAQYNLGIMHANGRGVPRSDAEAARWYRLAAEQGYVLAQSSLGHQYSTGTGVPRDLIQALMWLELAAGRGDARAIEDRDRVAQSMTSAQIVESRRLVAEWKSKPQPAQ